MTEKKENRLIVGNTEWAKCLPKRLLEEVTAERMILGLAGVVKSDVPKVGDAEVCVYLYTAGQGAPIPHALAQVYIYLASKFAKKWGRELEPFMEQKLKDGLTPNEERELAKLRKMIYQKRGGDIDAPALNFMRAFKQECDRMPKRANTLAAYFKDWKE
jgi:hypothetical protein